MTHMYIRTLTGRTMHRQSRINTALHFILQRLDKSVCDTIRSAWQNSGVEVLCLQMPFLIGRRLFSQWSRIQHQVGNDLSPSGWLWASLKIVVGKYSKASKQSFLFHRSGTRPSLQPPGCLRNFFSLFKPGNQRMKGQRTTDTQMATIVQSAQNRQQFEGWGTSLCWFANIVGGFPDPIRHHLMDLLFDHEKGLGIEICRYNIGGSGWSNKDTGNFRYGADIARLVSTLNV